MTERFVGIDVGSTTVKAVVMGPEGTDFLWKAYRRHDTKQAEHVHRMLTEIQAAFAGDRLHYLLTGSGARSLTKLVGGTFVQEVNAVQLAVESLYPDTGSVVELGGQDAKIIIWKPDVDGAGKRALASMNDKCAGGTGATIDKIVMKVGMELSEVAAVRFDPEKIHPIAARCGVFAETDVVGLIKAGIDGKEIISSLCDAIVKQNLQVLTRGNVLRDRVMLLGGPHQFIQCLAECWRLRIPETWEERKHEAADMPLEQLIYCPEDAQYFAAAGALFYGRRTIHAEAAAAAAKLPAAPVAKETVKLEIGRKMGGKTAGGEALIGIGIRREPPKADTSVDPLAKLHKYISIGRTEQLAGNANTLPPLIKSESEYEAFARQYRIPKFVPPPIEPNTKLGVYLGIDGGSTSTKAVLIDEQGEIVTTEYTLSNGNPLEDVRAIFKDIIAWAAEREVELDVLGSGATGYAAKILKETFDVDAAIVETVAHMMSSTKYYGDVDIICDIGGQDIKVIFMKNGRVSDFRLNTQCSAGNGYFLQSMAEQFGIPLEDYEQKAFEATISPVFNYGCAVFMEQDKVNLQQLGWNASEMLAGIAHVLPLNIWQYVVQEPNIAKHGRRIVLQGGTQKNLAAVKAQVDYLREKVPDAEIHVHKFAGESGAIGAALEARRRHQEDGEVTNFVGFEAGIGVSYTTKNDESTVCHFCDKNCRRTFIDTVTPKGNTTRHISGNSCLKGTVEDEAAMKLITLTEKNKKKETPNLFDFAARHLFRTQKPAPIADADDRVVEDVMQERKNWIGRRKSVPVRIERAFMRSSAEDTARRKGMIIAMPRVLMMYTGAPYFRAYFESLGCRVVWSEHTSEDLWADGSRWGSIDQCFPAKVANAHIYNLLTRRVKPHAIFFPLITHVPGFFHKTIGNVLCTIQTGTPEVCEASFTKGRNFFEEGGIEYWKPTVNMEASADLADSMYDYLEGRLNMTRDESDHAHNQGEKAYKASYAQLREHGRALVDQAVRDDAIIIMALGRPYHTDPGLNHEIASKFQVRGFPILGLDSIPWDDDFLMPLFEDDIRAGIIESPMQLSDVWHRSFNYDTNLKIWGAKVAARHPNMVSIDFSSFKCGHDAPTYHVIDGISDASESAHFVFHDLDQNNPASSIGIRIDSVCYFLDRMRNDLRRRTREQPVNLASSWQKPEMAVSVRI